MVVKCSLIGKTAVITHAGRGLGFSLARRFGQAGAHIVITEVDGSVGKNAAETLRHEGLSVSFEPLEVRHPAQSRTLVSRLEKKGQPIDIWINNNHILYLESAEKLPRKVWEDSIDIMLSGAFYCAQAVGRHMLARGRGVIVNMASVNAYQYIEGHVAYSTAKAGVVMLTQALGIEWARRGVRVVGLATGPDMTLVVQEGFDQGLASVETYQRRTPMRRLATPEEIAEAALFLASDEASYITAETMRVDGGWLAYNLF